MTCKKHWVFTGVFSWCALVLISSILYIVAGITILSTIVVLILVAWLVRIWCKKISGIQNRFVGEPTVIPWIPSSTRALFFTVLVIGLDGLLVALLYLSRETFALHSPWEIVSSFHFIVFGFTTFVLLLLSFKTQSRLLYSAIGFHSALVFGTAVFAFPFGFGFDPLIHQAAELYIAEHGKILPLQPFYIGQYALVGVVHVLSRVSIIGIDQWLLPVLATFSIPAVGMVSLRYVWKLPHAVSQASMVALPLLLVMGLTFTVPFNLTLVYLVWWLFLLPLIQESGWRGSLLLWMIVLTTLITHPLLGMGMLFATGGAQLLYRMSSRKRSVRYSWLRMIAFALLIGIGTLAMFGLYRVLQGESFVHTWMFWEHLGRFWWLFGFPYEVHHVSVGYQLLYYAGYGLLYGTIIFALVAMVRYTRVVLWVRQTILMLVLGTVLSAMLLSTMITIPGVIHYEQFEFVARLRNALHVMVFPMVVIPIMYAMYKLKEKGQGRRVVASVLLAGVITLGYYWMYPQHNDVQFRSGWNVAAHDIETVQVIEHHAQEHSYAVLSDQLIAAVGLREFGFENTVPTIDHQPAHRYAISPKEVLHPFAQQMLYARLAQDTLEQVFAAVAIDRLYVAIHEYWFRLDNIAQEAVLLGGTQLKSPYGVQVFYWDINHGQEK